MTELPRHFGAQLQNRISGYSWKWTTSVVTWFSVHIEFPLDTLGAGRSKPWVMFWFTLVLIYSRHWSQLLLAKHKLFPVGIISICLLYHQILILCEVLKEKTRLRASSTSVSGFTVEVAHLHGTCYIGGPDCHGAGNKQILLWAFWSNSLPHENLYRTPVTKITDRTSKLFQKIYQHSKLQTKYIGHMWFALYTEELRKLSKFGSYTPKLPPRDT